MCQPNFYKSVIRIRLENMLTNHILMYLHHIVVLKFYLLLFFKKIKKKSERNIKIILTRIQ